MEKVKSYPLFVPLSVIGLSALVAGLTFLLPTPPDVSDPVATHWRAAIATAPLFLFVGAAVIFLRGLKSFKAEMRSAYRLISFGMLAFSALLALLVFWGITDTWDSELATSGSGLVPFVVAAALTYVGARKFALLLKVESIFTGFWLTLIFTLVITLTMVVLAYYFVAYDLDGVELYIAVCSWGAIYLTCAAILIHKAAQNIGAYYRNATHWLVVGVACFAAASWHEAINTFWFNNGSTYTDYGYYLLPWIVAGLILVLASYKFRKLTAYGPVDLTQKTSITDSDYIDSVVAIANLVADPQEVDTMLDDLRIITSGLEPGQPLKEADKQGLIKTYHTLEDYLVQKDPLRTFTKNELLQHVTPAFRRVVSQV